MKCRLLVTVVTGMVIAADASSQEVAKETKALEGTWRVVSVDDGTKDPPEYFKRITYTFKGDTIHFLGDETTPGADLWLSYTIDPTKNPKTIDMKVTKTPDKKGLGTVSLGIYAFEGDQLKMCWSEKKRPAMFAGNEALQTAFIVLKRDKK